MPTTKVHLRCPVCTSFRAPAVLDSPDHAAAQMTQTFAGRGSITWQRLPLPYDQAVKLRDRMRLVLADLEAEIAEAEAGG
jgi:hypothetical protein